MWKRRVSAWVVVIAIARTALVSTGAQGPPASPAEQPSQTARIVRLDPGLDAVVPVGAAADLVYDGSGRLAEGPLWTRGGELLFSDMAANVIVRLTKGGRPSAFIPRAGYDGDPPASGPMVGSNGLTFDREGRLIVCERGNRRVTRRELNGQVTVLADRYQGIRLTRPNDVIVKRDGAIYFTDMCTDCTPDLPFQAVFRIRNGALDVAAEVPYPNGLAFSPDERHLYVSSSDRNRKIWLRFRVASDGTLGDRTVFFDATATEGGVPDGLKTDLAGNLYATGPGGVWIISPAGTALGRIELPGGAVNVAWGDDDGKTLYISGRAIHRLRLKVGGQRPCCP
jgi:gluconolactonase